MKWTVLGQAAGQAAMFAALPFLTRIYSAEVIGSFQMAMAVALLMTLLATQRLEVWILAAETAVVQRIVSMTRFGVIVVSLGCTALAVADVDGPYGSLLLGIACLVPPLALQNVDNAQRLRAQALYVVAARNAIFGLTTATLQVIGGMVWPSVFTLVGAVAVARLLAVMVVRGRRRQAPVVHGGIATFPPLSSRLSNLGAGLLGTLGGTAMVILTSFTFGLGAAGFLTMAQRLGTSPLAIAGSGVSQAASSMVGHEVRTGGSVAGAVTTLVKRLSLPCIAVSVGLFVAGWFLYVPLLGPSWEASRSMFLIFAAASGVQLMSSSLSSIFPLIMRQAAHLKLEAAKVLGIGLAYAGGSALNLPLTVTVLAAVSVQVGCYFALIVLLLHYSRQREAR